MVAPSSPGAVRRLQRLTTDDGRFHVIALDHRDSLRRAAADDGVDLDDAGLVAFKRDVLRAASPLVTGVMLDPELSWPGFAVDSIVPRDVGVICALEDQGYEADVATANRWLPGWDPVQLAASGADAAKLLVLYRPDGSEVATRQEELVQRTVEACEQLQLPLLVEPVPVGVADDERADAIVRTVERLATMGPMVLKLPFPGVDACERVTAGCEGTPWVLLSWGADFETFADQFRRAAAAGCAGFAVGRAVWREALDDGDRAAVLPMVADRLERLVVISSGR